MSKPRSPSSCLESRRAFLRAGALFAAGTVTAGSWISLGVAHGEEEKPSLSCGLITDIHSADKPAGGSRHYRQGKHKLKKIIADFNEKKPSFVVELGDLIDRAPSVEVELKYLAEIEAVYSQFKGPRHYVFGNHCVQTLTKEEFIANSGAKKPYYSFDQGDFHFIILDACYRSDGKSYHRDNFKWDDCDIPAKERAWLTEDLAKTDKRCVVFAHQRIDLKPGDAHGINSCKETRAILSKSKKIVAVFQGHNHVNDLRRIDGVTYITLPAIVETADKTASSILDLYSDGSFRLSGFGETKTYPRLELRRF